MPGRLLNLLGTRSFRRCRGSVPLSSLLMEDRISDAVKERLDVLGPPQVVDGGGHVMQAGRELLEVGAQGRDRCGFDQRLAENPAPSIPAGRWPTVPKYEPVNRLPRLVDRVPAVGHSRHGDPRSPYREDHRPFALDAASSRYSCDPGSTVAATKWAMIVQTARSVRRIRLGAAHG